MHKIALSWMLISFILLRRIVPNDISLDMANENLSRKIIWSVDAFQEDRKLFKKTLSFLNDFDSIPGVTIEPVYVLSPDQLNIPVEFAPPWVEQYLPSAEKALKKLLEKTGLKNLKAPKVIIESQSSLGATVSSFVQYALKQKADFVLVSSHSKKGLKRMFLGSFAESLVLESKTPIVVVGPQSNVPEKIDHIFFATDLSAASKKAIPNLIRLADELGAKVTIFYSVPNPIEPVVQSGVFLLAGAWVSLRSFVGDEVKKRTRIAKEWAQEFKAAGVKADVVVTIAKKNVSEEVMDEAKKRKASMIAMVAKRGTVASALIGSVTRQVVRSSPLPVWVIRGRS